MRESPVEGLADIRLEEQAHVASRCPRVTVGEPLHQLVEFLGVSRRDVLHVGHVLEPSLDLERRDPCLRHAVEAVELAEVLEREEVFSPQELLPLCVFEVELHAAHLGALAPVGAALEERLADEALAAVGDTEGAMDEGLEAQLRAAAVYVADFGQGELTREHHLLKSQSLERLRLVRRAVVHLRGRMERYGRQAETEKRHVLDDERVDPGFVEVADETLDEQELVVVDDGVDRDVDLGMEKVGEGDETTDVVELVSRSCTRPECVGTDIYGIGTVAYGLDAGVGVACGSEKLKEFEV